MLRVQVIVEPPNAAWTRDFEAEAKRLREALAPAVVEIHHIGSTAIPRMYAKPIIDILLVMLDLAAFDKATPTMKRLGYEAMGEFGISGRRYFRKTTPNGVRTHHVHGFQVGSADIARHVAFRDYMIAHPSAAAAYSALKQRLAHAHPDDIEAYMNGKDGFIKEHEARAVQWVSRRGHGKLG